MDDDGAQDDDNKEDDDALEIGDDDNDPTSLAESKSVHQLFEEAADINAQSSCSAGTINGNLAPIGKHAPIEGGAGGAIAIVQTSPNPANLQYDGTANGGFYSDSSQLGFTPYLHVSSTRIIGTRFANNSAACACPGGAISFVNTDLNLTNCLLSNNEAGGKGGAVYGQYSFIY